jgi:hypothetical protein
MIPRNFSGREFCPGEPGPASKGPAVLGICHTCGHYSMQKPTIKPDVFTHATGPARGTKDCKNWVPNGTQSHRPAALGGSDEVAVGTHANTVQHRTEQGKPLSLGGEVANSEHTAAVMCGNEQEQAA